MATIYKRGKYWWVAYKDKSGRRVQKSLKVTDGKDAKQLKKHYTATEIAESLTGTPLQQEPLFETWITEYQAKRLNRVAKATYAREDQAIRSLKASIKRRRLNQITPNDIDFWYGNLLKIHAVATANCLLRHVKAFFNAAVNEKYLITSPCKNVKPVKEAQKQIRVLTKDEVNAILDVMPLNWRDLIMVAIFTGARSGEICRFKVMDVDLEAATPTITISSTQTNPTKSKKTRTVPLPRTSIDFFERLIEGKDPNAYLVVNPSGGQWKPRWISKGFSKYCKIAGVENATFHDLRRTYGAWLVMRGADLVTIQENLGHSDISVTIKHYTHLVITHRAEQTDKFPDL